jgi:hypothetical protein
MSSISSARRSAYQYELRRHFSPPRALFWPTLTLTLFTGALFYWTIARMWERCRSRWERRG